MFDAELPTGLKKKREQKMKIIFMRNSVPRIESNRASGEMNHVVNANECFEIDSNEMSKTHLRIDAHTHTHTHDIIHK